eukprot:4123096-Pyramimonas_sp.AAC.1
MLHPRGDLICPVAARSAPNPCRTHVGRIGYASTPCRIRARSAPNRRRARVEPAWAHGKAPTWGTGE